MNVPEVSGHGWPDCGNDWVEFIESLCKIKGLSVDYLILLGFGFLLHSEFSFAFWGGSAVKSNEVRWVLFPYCVLCMKYSVQIERERTVRCRMDQKSRTN